MSDLIDAHCAQIRARLSERTASARQEWLYRADREMPYGLVDADRGEILAFLGRRGWKAWTRNKAHYHLAAFFAWGVDPRNGKGGVPVLGDNPMAGLDPPKVRQGHPRPVSDEELRIVLERAREPYRTAVLLAVGAGLRCCELTRIKRENINEETVWVDAGKGGLSAGVPTSAELWEHVRDFPRGRILGHVGGIDDERKMSARASIYFTRTLKLPGVCLHRFRHKYAELLRRGGADAATIQLCMRHQDISSTQIYMRATEAECRFAVSTLRLRDQTPN